MEKIVTEKYRHELKYVCSEQTLLLIEQKLQYLLQPDPHADEQNEYLIRSVYFDDIYRTCYYENEFGIDSREKFRIRIYNCSQDSISLEKKKKNRGMTGKEKCGINYDTCMKMLRGESIIDCLGQSTLLDEWIILNETKLFRPAMLGEYVRRPYVYEPGNVRITLDMNISASNEYDGLFEKDIGKMPVLSGNRHVLEVKYDDFLPDAVKWLLHNEHIQQTKFSKFYYGCRALRGE